MQSVRCFFRARRQLVLSCALLLTAALPSLRAQTLLSWDFTGENTLATSTAEVKNANLDSSGDLTRGSGATASAGANSFRTTGFQNNGISTANTDYFQFVLSAANGFSLSLSTIDYKTAGTASYVFAAPTSVSVQFGYSLNGTDFTLIANPAQYYTTATTAVTTAPQINLAGISELQLIDAGTTVTFRFYASGNTTTGGFGFGGAATAGTIGLAIGGSLVGAGTSTLIWSGASGDIWNTSDLKFSSGAVAWTNGNSTANFATASQNVTVDAVTAGTVKLSANAIALSGGTITDGNSSGGLIVEVTNTGETGTLSSAVSSSNGLTKSGAGTLVLGGTQSSLSGTITVAAGTLQSDTTTVGSKNISNSGTLVLAQSSDGTYSGTMSNGGVFTKSGAGNLTISNSVSGSGSTTITGGTVTAGANNVVASGALTMSTGTTLNLASNSATVASLNLTGSAISNVGTLTLNGALTTVADATATTISSGTLALGGTSRTFTVANGAAASDLTISSALTSGTGGGFTKSGAGTLTLTGDNSGLTGPVSLGSQGATPADGGTLVINGNNSLGTSTSTSAFRFNSGVLNVAAPVTLSLATSIGGRNNGVTVSTISGSDLTLAGNTSFFKAASTTGTLHLNVNNNTTISGNLVASTSSGSGGTLGTATGVVLGGTGTLVLSGADNNLYAENTTISDTLTVRLSGAATNLLGTGTVAVNSGAVLNVNGTSQTIANLGGGTGSIVNNATGTASTLTVGNANAGSFAGVIADNTTGTGTIALTKAGSGTVTLSAANTYTGGTTINAGTLALGDAAALGTTGDITFGGGTLQYGTGITTDLSNRIANSTAGAIIVDTNGNDVTFASALAANNTGGLVKIGAGTLILAANNANTGLTTIRNGTLKASTSQVIADTVNVVLDAIAENATAIFDLNGHNETIGALTFGGTGGTNVTNSVATGAGLLTLGGDVTYVATGNPGASISGFLELGANRTFTVANGSATNDLTVSALISGTSRNLTKTGAGTLNLSGANTYSGTTTISAGTLALGSAGSFANSATINLGTTGSTGTLDLTAKSSFSFGAGQTLTGVGTVNIGTGKVVTVGGTLTPGNSTGIVNITGDFTLSSGAISNFEINGTTAGTDFDQLNVTGLLTYGGALNLIFGAPIANDITLDLFGLSGSGSAGSFSSITGTGSYAGSFTNNSGNWTFDTGSQLVTFVQSTGDLSFAASAIPEPSTYAAIFGGVALLGVAIRRRRQKQAATAALKAALQSANVVQL